MVAEGKLDDDDYDRMLPFLTKKMDDFGEVNWYFQMKDFKGWSFNAFWRDVQFDVKDHNRLGKVAMVGENKWHEAMTEFMKPFTDAEIRYFKEEEAQAARQ